MKRISIVILLLTVFIANSFAGESLFGTSRQSIGMLSVPYSAPGMGRSYEIASTDTTQINYMNYSLWPAISLTSYSVKLGFKAAYGQDADNDYYNDVANFSGGFLTVPLMKRKLSFGIGLLPFSDMEQRYRDEDIADSTATEILVKGGLSKAVMNFSYKVLPNFGIGLGYEYNFGKITKNFRYEDNKEEYDPLRFIYEYRFYGHGVVFSSHYSPNDKLIFGLIYRPKVKMDFRIQANTNSDEVDKASVHSITIPSQVSFGAEYRLAKRWTAGLDFMYQDWKTEYTVEDETPGTPFTEYVTIGGGIEKTHSRKLFTSIFEKMDYRAGVFFRKLSQTSAQEIVNEYGISLGFSLPLQRFRSKIDFAGLVGTRGDVSQNRYQETFYKIGISVSAMETWFVKLKD